MKKQKVVTGDLAASEALATKRVMRHRGLSRKEAAAYVINRLGQGRAAGGMIIEKGKLRPHTAAYTKPKTAPPPVGPNPNAARTSDKPVTPGPKTPGRTVPTGTGSGTPGSKNGTPPSTGAVSKKKRRTPPAPGGRKPTGL